MALLTTAEGRTALGGGVSDNATDNAIVDAFVSAIGTQLAQYCRFPRTASGTWTLESASYTFYLTGEGGERLRLPVKPIVSITSIYDDTLRVYGADTLVASGDYSTGLDADLGVVYLLPSSTKGAWSNGIPRAIKATVTAGYATVDEAIKEAARATLRAAWTRRKLGEATQSLSSSGVSVSVAPSDIPAVAKALLAPRRVLAM